MSSTIHNAHVHHPFAVMACCHLNHQPTEVIWCGCPCCRGLLLPRPSPCCTVGYCHLNPPCTVEVYCYLDHRLAAQFAIVTFTLPVL